MDKVEAWLDEIEANSKAFLEGDAPDLAQVDDYPQFCLKLTHMVRVYRKHLQDIINFEGGVLQPDASKSCAMREIAREAEAEVAKILGVQE